MSDLATANEALSNEVLQTGPMDHTAMPGFESLAQTGESEEAEERATDGIRRLTQPCSRILFVFL
jgi:hypothetical protein